MKWRVPTILFLLALSGCGSGSSAVRQWWTDNTPNYKTEYFLSVTDRELIADNQRTPVGLNYGGQETVIQAGTELSIIDSAGIIRQITQNSDSYRQGSWHLTTLINDDLWAIDMRAKNAARQRIIKDPDSANWLGQLNVFDSPTGTLLETIDFRIDELPGNADTSFMPYSFFATDSYIFISLHRYDTRPETWLVGDEPREVSGSVGSSWLIRASLADPSKFNLVGKIADFSDYLQIAEKSKLPNYLVPLYYAAAPKCIGFSDKHLICALRTSADDDDGNRPLNLTEILEPIANTAPENRDYFYGHRIVKTVYVPQPEDSIYYVPKENVAIPPMMMATTKDGGQTWDYKFIAERGGLDTSFYFDQEKKLLIVAYGALTYPRRGTALQWSFDYGQTWSEPQIITNGDDKFTTGNVFLSKVGDGEYTVYYDSLERYIELDYTQSPPRQDPEGYQIFRRKVKIDQRSLPVPLQNADIRLNNGTFIEQENPF